MTERAVEHAIETYARAWVDVEPSPPDLSHMIKDLPRPQSTALPRVAVLVSVLLIAATSITVVALSGRNRSAPVTHHVPVSGSNVVPVAAPLPAGEKAGALDQATHRLWVLTREQGSNRLLLDEFDPSS